MIRSKRGGGDRRGMSIVECALVYPLAILLLMGTIVIGLGVFRFQQLEALAREGARYASVHGPSYASATGNAQASTSSVQTYVQGLAVSLSGLTCTEVQYTYASTTPSLPCTVTVGLNYTWTPGGFFGAIQWTVTSTMAVTY
jgi:Flp pilus assembly protein TadG